MRSFPSAAQSCASSLPVLPYRRNWSHTPLELLQATNMSLSVPEPLLIVPLTMTDALDVQPQNAKSPTEVSVTPVILSKPLDAIEFIQSYAPVEPSILNAYPSRPP